MINKLTNECIVKLTYPNYKIEHTFHTDSSFSVLKWEFYNLEKGSDISAERRGNRISITGQFNNKEYEKEFKIDDLPWYQSWGLGLKAFINSDNKSTAA